MSNKLSKLELPFTGKIKNINQLSYWNIPDEGNYFDGIKVGEIMAAQYLQFLSTPSNLPPSLPKIVIDADTNKTLSSAKHGQIVGFFSILEKALSMSLKSEQSRVSPRTTQHQP